MVPPSVAASESGGVHLRITACSRNLIKHERSNQTSGTRNVRRYFAFGVSPRRLFFLMWPIEW